MKPFSTVISPSSTFSYAAASTPSKFKSNPLRCSLYGWWCNELHPPHHQCPFPCPAMSGWGNLNHRRRNEFPTPPSFCLFWQRPSFSFSSWFMSFRGGFVVCRYKMGQLLLQRRLWRRSPYCFLIRCVIDSWWAFQCFDSLIIVQICWDLQVSRLRLLEQRVSHKITYWVLIITRY